MRNHFDALGHERAPELFVLAVDFEEGALVHFVFLFRFAVDDFPAAKKTVHFLRFALLRVPGQLVVGHDFAAVSALGLSEPALNKVVVH